MMWSSDHPVPPSVPVFSVCLNVHDTRGCSFAPGPHLTAGVATLASVPSLCGTDRLRSSHIILPRAGCQNERKHIGGLSSGSGRQSRWGVFTAWSRRLTAATETPAIRSTVSGYLSQCSSPSTYSRAVQTSQALSQGSRNASLFTADHLHDGGRCGIGPRRPWYYHF